MVTSYETQVEVAGSSGFINMSSVESRLSPRTSFVQNTCERLSAFQMDILTAAGSENHKPSAPQVHSSHNANANMYVQDCLGL